MGSVNKTNMNKLFSLFVKHLNEKLNLGLSALIYRTVLFSSIYNSPTFRIHLWTKNLAWILLITSFFNSFFFPSSLSLGIGFQLVFVRWMQSFFSVSTGWFSVSTLSSISFEFLFFYFLYSIFDDPNFTHQMQNKRRIMKDKVMNLRKYRFHLQFFF